LVQRWPWLRALVAVLAEVQVQAPVVLARALRAFMAAALQSITASTVNILEWKKLEQGRLDRDHERRSEVAGSAKRGS
jgi:hypothetical protein